MLIDLLKQAIHTGVKASYVLFDSWLSFLVTILKVLDQGHRWIGNGIQLTHKAANMLMINRDMICKFNIFTSEFPHFSKWRDEWRFSGNLACGDSKATLSLFPKHERKMELCPCVCDRIEYMFACSRSDHLCKWPISFDSIQHLNKGRKWTVHWHYAGNYITPRKNNEKWPTSSREKRFSIRCNKANYQNSNKNVPNTRKFIRKCCKIVYGG